MTTHDAGYTSLSSANPTGGVALRKLNLAPVIGRGAASEFGDVLNSNFDLSFLDLLTSLDGNASPTKPASEKTDKKKEAEKTDNKASSTSKLEASATITSAEQRKAEASQRLEDEWALSDRKRLDADALTDTDRQYINQMLIPNLPILMGQVPFQSVFGANGTSPAVEGGISYRGFSISPGLEDMIQHGFKSGQPIRLEMDGQSALILKIRSGQVSAEFVSTDYGAAMTLQQELNALRNELVAKNLPVGTLESKYNESRQQNRQQQPEQENSDKS